MRIDTSAITPNALNTLIKTVYAAIAGDTELALQDLQDLMRGSRPMVWQKASQHPLTQFSAREKAVMTQNSILRTLEVSAVYLIIP